jgi:hypothetical protein
VVAANLAALSSTAPGRAAHANWVLHYETFCSKDTSGQTLACQTASYVMDDFATQAVCNKVATAESNTACALFESIAYGAKNKDILDIIGKGQTILQLGQWMYELYNYCIANYVACNQITSSGMCEVEDYGCTGDDYVVGTDYIEDGVADGLPYMVGEGEEDLGEDTGWSAIAFPGGWAEAESSYGYGSWGVLTEISDVGSGGNPCEVTGPANGVAPAICD